MTYFSATEIFFRTSQLGNKGFSARWAEKEGFLSLKMESKNEFSYQSQEMKFWGSIWRKRRSCFEQNKNLADLRNIINGLFLKKNGGYF